jgi:hypothetical protein
MERFRSLHAGEEAVIIGKGPSLNKLSTHNILYTEVVYCVNDAVEIVEKLHLFNTIYIVQQDGKQLLSHPSPYIHFCSSTALPFSYGKGIMYDRAMFGVQQTSRTVMAAIEIAKFMGIRKIGFIAFDGCVSGDINYAEGVKKPDRCKNYEEGLKLQRKEIELRCKWIEISWR